MNNKKEEIQIDKGAKQRIREELCVEGRLVWWLWRRRWWRQKTEEAGEVVVEQQELEAKRDESHISMASICLSLSSLSLSTSKSVSMPSSFTSSSSPCCGCSLVLMPLFTPPKTVKFMNYTRIRRAQRQIVRMAPDEEKLTRRNPLDFPIEWERPKPGRRPDIFPQFSPMKTPLPPPLPCDPPEEDEEEEEKKEEEEEDPEKEEPDEPENQ
ncbi:hypothetical protein ACSBR2_005698 [Camellia fascicularis]